MLAKPRIVPTLPEAIAGCALPVATTVRERHERPFLTPREVIGKLAAARGPVAVVFGDEKNGLTTELKTEGCDAPLVFTTLSGDRSHWYTTGASSIYGADPNGFQLYVGRSGVTPAFATDNGWHVHWTRVAPTVPRTALVE
jgi:hypothetical protein